MYVKEAVWPLFLLNQFLSRFDYASEYASARKELAKGLSSGAIKRKFHIVEGGIEQAPISLPMLFSGGNTGKLCVEHLSYSVNPLMALLGLLRSQRSLKLHRLNCKICDTTALSYHFFYIAFGYDLGLIYSIFIHRAIYIIYNWNINGFSRVPIVRTCCECLVHGESSDFVDRL